MTLQDKAGAGLPCMDLPLQHPWASQVPHHGKTHAGCQRMKYSPWCRRGAACSEATCASSLCNLAKDLSVPSFQFQLMSHHQAHALPFAV